MRLVVGGAIDDGGGVEDRDVGTVAFAQEAAVGQPEDPGRAPVILCMALGRESRPRSRA
jgi:hypothetical protein